MMEEQEINVSPEEVGIDTGWSNPPSLTDLKQDLQDSQSHHDGHVTEVSQWLDNLNVTGNARVKKEAGRSAVVPKLIRKQAEWRYAALSESFLSHEDLFTCEPRTFEDKASAYQSQVLLNYQFNCQIDKVAFIDQYVRSAVDEGSVLVRVGWDFEEEDVEVPNMVLRPLDPRNDRDRYLLNMIEVASKVLLEKGPEAAQAMPPEIVEAVQVSMRAGRPSVMEEQGTKTVKKTVRNQPTLEVCDYDNIIVDPLCKGNIDKAGFIIFEFETSRSELEKEGKKYKNLDNVNYERNAVNARSTISEADEDTGSFNYKDSARKKVTAYEYWGYWDINGTGAVEPIVATWIGDTLIRLEASPFPDKKLPFVLVQYLPRRKHVYGEPDGSLLEDNQKIIGAITRGMIDIMGRSANGQTGMRKDALDLTNMRKFEAGKDYYFNPQVDPRSSFYQHVFPEIPQSAPFMIQLQHNEAEAITGVKAFHGGISGEGMGKSATAARSALDAAGKRELGILRRLANGVIEIGRKVMAMNAVYLSEEEVIRVTNEEFVNVKRDDLSGEYDIRMKISTMEADNVKAEELSFMLQTVGNTMPPEFAQMILGDIATLRKMPDLAKRIQEFKPQPDPMREMMMKLELAKLEAEVLKLQSEARENNAEAALDMAQANKAQSEADLKDLDFVEQESGVKQAQELQKQGEQARANMALEAMKAGLQDSNSSNS